MGLRHFSATEFTEYAAHGRCKAHTVYVAVRNVRPFEVGDCHARAARLCVGLHIQYLICMSEFILLLWLTIVV